jgi:hypothetical protein
MFLKTCLTIFTWRLSVRNHSVIRLTNFICLFPVTQSLIYMYPSTLDTFFFLSRVTTDPLFLITDNFWPAPERPGTHPPPPPAKKYSRILGLKSWVLLTLDGESHHWSNCTLLYIYCLLQLMIFLATIEWLIIYCFTSRSIIFHNVLYMETSPLPVKGWKI